MNPPPSDLEALLKSRDFLRSIARGLLLDEDRAEDVVQETCVRALERPPRKLGAARAWLARVARNAALDLRRRESLRSDVERRAARPEAVEAEERDLELQQQVVEAVRRLEPPYRTAVYLRYFRNLSPGDIARELEVPVATVKTRLRRGLEALRAELDRKHGGDRRQWSVALLALALPELAPAAEGAVGLGAALKGIILMNKSIAAGAAALVLIAAATVTWYASQTTGPVAPDLSPRESPPIAEATPADEPETAVEPSVEASPQEMARVAVETPAATAPAGATGASSGGLVGRVLDPSGRPVTGARVRAHEGPGGRMPGAMAGLLLSGAEPAAEETTDAEGRFHLRMEQDGSFQLLVDASGYAPFRKEVSAYFDRRTDIGELVLDPGVFLSGRVVDSAGRPVEGAAIRPSTPEQSANVIRIGGIQEPAIDVTGRDGSFLVDRQAVGPWALEITSDRHPSRQVSGETRRAGQRVDGLEVVLEDGVEIAGRLAGMPAGEHRKIEVRASAETAGAGGLAIGGLVDLGGSERSAPVSADGSFRLVGLREDQGYRLRAYEGKGMFGSRARSDSTEATAGELDVELAWSAGAALVLQVVDAESGAPIEGFEVRAGFEMAWPLMRDGQPVLEHPGGNVRFDGLRPPGASGTARLEIRAPGFADLDRADIHVVRDQDAYLGAIALRRVPVVRVTAVDQRGAPVEGASVSLTPESEGGQPGMIMRRVQMSPDGMRTSDSRARGRNGVTDADGVVELTSLPGERCTIAVRASRFAPYESEPLDLPEALDVDHAALLLRGATVEVRVVDERGDPVPGAMVERRAPGGQGGFSLGGGGGSRIRAGARGGAGRRVADSVGAAFFRNLEAGVHAFRLTEEGAGTYSSGGMSLRMAGGGGSEQPWTEVALEGGLTELLTLTAPSPGSLSGRITEAGEPLFGSEVRLVDASEGSEPPIPGFEEGPTTSVDSTGRYSFDGVTPGSYELVVAHPTRVMPARRALEVRAGDNRLDVDLPVSIVEGRVTDAEGEPLAGVQVRAERYQGQQATRRTVVMLNVVAGGDGDGGAVVSTSDGGSGPVHTDEDGRFVLRGVPADAELVVRAEMEEFEPASSEPFRVAPYETRGGLDLVLEQGGGLVVEVVQGDDEPAPNTLVTARLTGGGGGQPKIAMTGPEGRAAFTDLSPGVWSVSVSSMGMGGGGEPPDPQEAEVRRGEEARLRFEMD